MEKLNSVYEEYAKGKVTFDKVYEAATKQREIHKRIVSKYTGVDETAALEIFDDAIVFLLSKDKPHVNFENALNSRLKSRRINLIRDTNRRRQRIKSLDGMTEEEGEDKPSNIAVVESNYSLEDDVLQRNKEADQRQLIDFLTQTAKSDTTTMIVVEAYMQAPLSASRNEIAKYIGIHHEVIKRRLTALSRYYDENRFGDRRDYLAV